MTDYPQHITAAVDKLIIEKGINFNTLCLALTMTPPEPPKDVLVEAYSVTFPEDYGIPSICAMLRTELARLGHEVAPIRQPVSEEVIEQEAVEIYNNEWRADRPKTNTIIKLIGFAIRRGIELAGGK